jgi:hypothetical protein
MLLYEGKPAVDGIKPDAMIFLSLGHGFEQLIRAGLIGSHGSNRKLKLHHIIYELWYEIRLSVDLNHFAAHLTRFPAHLSYLVPHLIETAVRLLAHFAKQAQRMIFRFVSHGSLCLLCAFEGSNRKAANRVNLLPSQF